MNTARQQSGVVLIMTLVILLVVTLLGTSSIQMTGMLEKMSRNATDGASALGAANAALQAAERSIESEVSAGTYDNLDANGDPIADADIGNGKYNTPATPITPRWQDDAMWRGGRSVAFTYGGGANAEPPRYFIERIRPVLSEEDRLNLDNVGGGTGADRTWMYRITALGTGRTTAAKVYVQSTYGKKF